MSDEQEKSDNPVVSGLVALLAVSVAVGLVLAGVALVATQVLGIGDDSSSSAGASRHESAIIPRPSHTGGSGPQVTLDTEETSLESEDAGPGATESSTEATEREKAITLQAGQTAVGNFDRIDLSGVYPGGEGAILQVQRKLGGTWQDFLSVDAAVSGGQFETYVQTGQLGVQKFRMRDTTSGITSNVVSVTVG